MKEKGKDDLWSMKHWDASPLHSSKTSRGLGDAVWKLKLLLEMNHSSWCLEMMTSWISRMIEPPLSPAVMNDMTTHMLQPLQSEVTHRVFLLTEYSRRRHQRSCSWSWNSCWPAPEEAPKRSCYHQALTPEIFDILESEPGAETG